MRSVIRILLIVLTRGLALDSTAQEFNFINYNSNNSRLPHDIVYHLRQDQNGFIWAGTDDGLVRLDGNDIAPVDKGFRSKYVIATDEDEGSVWACSWKGGISRIVADSAITVPAADSMYHDANDKIFLFRTNSILVFEELIISHTFDSYIIHRYNREKNLLVPVSLDDRKDSVFNCSRADGASYFRFIKTSAHRLLAYNHTGIFEVRKGKLYKISDLVADKLWQSGNGALYMLSRNAIYLTNPACTSQHLIYRLERNRPDGQRMTDFRILPSGNLCIMIRPESARVHTTFLFVNQLTRQVVDLEEKVTGAPVSFALVDAEGGLWLSSYGKGLFHLFDIRSRQLGGEDVFENPTVTDLMRTRDSTLLIGTREGLYSLQKGRLQRHSIPGIGSNFWAIAISERGDESAALNVASSSGGSALLFAIPGMHRLYDNEIHVTPHYLFRIDKDFRFILTDRSGKTDYSDRLPFRSYFIRLCEDHEGRLWLAGLKGLYFFRPDLGAVRFNKLDGAQINCITNGGPMGLWIGTGNGLYLVRKDLSVKYWGTDDGLSNLSVTAIVQDDPSSIWIGTQNGLFHLREGQLRVYKKRDGLIANDVTAMLRYSAAELAVGSSRGLTFLNTDSELPVGAPRLLARDIIVNGESVSWRKSLTVPFRSHIEFRFASVTFVYPELQLYQYRLRESEGWRDLAGKSLELSNVEPGDYQVQIRVKKYNTGFSAPLSMRMTVGQPWWRSWYFIPVVFVFLAGTLTLLFVRHNRRQKKELQKKQEFAELKMKALQAQMNPHFVSNTLNSIQYFIFRRDEISANTYLAQFADLTRSFLEVSRRTFISLEMELHVVKNYLSLEQLRLEEKLTYEIRMDSEVDPELTQLPGLIIQPFVENSINHGIAFLPAGQAGNILLNIAPESEAVRITIEDNGIGRRQAMALKKRDSGMRRSHAGAILEELQVAYNSIPGCHISISTLDLEDEKGIGRGTRVDIVIKNTPQSIVYEAKRHHNSHY